MVHGSIAVRPNRPYSIRSVHRSAEWTRSRCTPASGRFCRSCVSSPQHTVWSKPVRCRVERGKVSDVVLHMERIPMAKTAIVNTWEYRPCNGFTTGSWQASSKGHRSPRAQSGEIWLGTDWPAFRGSVHAHNHVIFLAQRCVTPRNCSLSCPLTSSRTPHLSSSPRAQSPSTAQGRASSRPKGTYRPSDQSIGVCGVL
jgi:hypothetical protein